MAWLARILRRIALATVLIGGGTALFRLLRNPGRREQARALASRIGSEVSATARKAQEVRSRFAGEAVAEPKAEEAPEEEVAKEPGPSASSDEKTD